MNIEEAIKILDYKINMYKEDVFIGDLDKTNIEAIKKVLKEIERLKEENEVLNGILETQRKRKYYSKFLKDFQKENGKNVFPDFDEIYKRYDDYKERIDKAIEYLDGTDFIRFNEYYKIADMRFYENMYRVLKGEDNNVV